MIYLQANSALNNVYAKVIKASGQQIKWKGIFLVRYNTVILVGEVKSLYLDLDKRTVATGAEDFVVSHLEQIGDYKLLTNLMNMLLYAFGKWKTVKGLKVEQDYETLGALFRGILKEVDAVPFFTESGYKFAHNQLQITFEEVVQFAVDKRRREQEEKIAEDIEENMGLWHSMKWRVETIQFERSDIGEEDVNSRRLGHNFYMTPYECPDCGAHLHMAVYPEGNEFKIETDEGNVFLARVYSCPACNIFYTPRPEMLLREGEIYVLALEDDDEATKDYRRLLGEGAVRTANGNFNLFERDYYRKGRRPKKTLPQICRDIELLTKEEMDEILAKIQEGFFSERDRERFQAIIEQELHYRNETAKRQRGEFGEPRDNRDDAAFENEREDADLQSEDAAVGLSAREEAERALRETLSERMSDGSLFRAEESPQDEEGEEKQEIPDKAVKEDSTEAADQSYLQEKGAEEDNEERASGKIGAEGVRGERVSGKIGAEGVRGERASGKIGAEGVRGERASGKIGAEGVRGERAGEKTGAEGVRGERASGKIGAEGVRRDRTSGKTDAEKGSSGRQQEDAENGLGEPSKKKGFWSRKSRNKAVYTEVPEEETGEETVSARMHGAKFEQDTAREEEAEEIGADADITASKVSSQHEYGHKDRTEKDVKTRANHETEPKEVGERPVAGNENADDRYVGGHDKTDGLSERSLDSAGKKSDKRSAETVSTQQHTMSYETHDRDRQTDRERESPDEIDYQRRLKEDEEKAAAMFPDPAEVDFADGMALLEALKEEELLPEIRSGMIDQVEKRLTRLKVDEADQLVEKLKREMQGKLSDYSRIYFYDARKMLKGGNTDKSSSLIRTAVSTYAYSLADYEYPLMICDSSIFGGGKEGFILSPDHLFYKGIIKSGAIDIKNIESFETNAAKRGRGIVLRHSTAGRVKLPCTLSYSDSNAMAEVLDSFVRYLKEKPESRSISYLSQKSHSVKRCYRCGHVIKQGEICPNCGSKVLR